MYGQSYERALKMAVIALLVGGAGVGALLVAVCN